ncbi:hypothetical protein ACI3EY_07975 [Ornithinimicrobium sp. LYQ92]|uniref:hypothetical protein n=1 Tax=Serinicoccus sp. LYQ92 TaxID=3378798 RepID=UPI0038534BDB
MADTTTLQTSELAQLEHLVETLEESLTDAQRMLAAEDRGWSLADDGTVRDRATIREEARLGRTMAIVDPLIRRAVNLRIAYVWGSGVTIGASAGDDTEGGPKGTQNVNEVVQAFLDDQASTFSSAQACEERERSLMTDGNVHLSLVTDPVTGRVQVRTIPDAQIDDVLTDPEDAETPWFYKRTWTQTGLQAARDRATGKPTTITRTQSRTAYYPALGFRPKARPRTIDGHPVMWDCPVLHVRVNRPSGSKWGTSDLTSAMAWARGYRDFLTDWAKLVKALSAFAFRATAKNARSAAQVRSKIASPAETGVGGTVITPEGQSFEAIGKSGATIDSNSGRPLAAMVASATDVPVTMLTADPGVTGARATAETLDKPLALVTMMRRDLAAGTITRVLDHVIDAAIRAPRGPLTGTVTIDRYTGAERVILTGEQSRGIVVDWPSLEDVDVKTIVEAIVKADQTGKIPDEVTIRLLLVALDVDNADEVIEGMRDDNGAIQLPDDVRAAASALAGVGAGRGTTGTE